MLHGLGVQARGHTAAVDLVERKGSSSTRHPWEVARAEFFLRLLGRRGLLETNGDWLDAGAGDAWFAGQLRRLLPPAATNHQLVERLQFGWRVGAQHWKRER